MATLARTPSGDIDISTHNLVIVTDPVQCAAIALADRLALGLGEWFLDTRLGVPYLQVLGVKNPDLSAIRAMFRSIILSTPTIVDVVELNTQFLKASRTFSYFFRAKCNTGQVIQGGPGFPFLVTPPGALN